MPNTIILKGRDVCIRKEGVTDEAVTPGHLIERGGSNDVQKHSSAGQNALKAWAVENDLVGDDIDDAYVSGETVQYMLTPTGAEVYAYVAYGETVSIGDALESNGDGTLRKHTAPSIDESGSATTTVYSDAIVAYAKEAKTNTTGGAAVRIKVEAA